MNSRERAHASDDTDFGSSDGASDPWTIPDPPPDNSDGDDWGQTDGASDPRTTPDPPPDDTDVDDWGDAGEPTREPDRV